MAWIQPFLNWVAGMIPTKDDFNRIEGNTQYLKDEIDTQTADLALGLQNHETAVDPHTQYTLDSEYNGHVGFQATESAKGHIEIATQAEVTAGTDTKRAVVPKYLKTELDKRLLSSAYTAADVLAKIKTVDGAGSGLDADTWRGLEPNNFKQLSIDGSAIKSYSTSPSYQNSSGVKYLAVQGNKHYYINYESNVVLERLMTAPFTETSLGGSGGYMKGGVDIISSKLIGITDKSLSSATNSWTRFFKVPLGSTTRQEYTWSSATKGISYDNFCIGNNENECWSIKELDYTVTSLDRLTFSGTTATVAQSLNIPTLLSGFVDIAYNSQTKQLLILIKDNLVRIVSTSGVLIKNVTLDPSTIIGVKAIAYDHSTNKVYVRDGFNVHEIKI